jgi:hypothetical protein
MLATMRKKNLFAVDMSLMNFLRTSGDSDSFLLEFNSINAAGNVKDLNCSREKTCNGNGECIAEPLFDFDSLSITSCVCDFYFNGTNCENFIGYQTLQLELFRAQSLSTNESDHLENVFDTGNVDMAPAQFDSPYACNFRDSIGVVQYILEVSPNFKSYEYFNDADSGSFDKTMTKRDRRVGFNGDGYYSFPKESRCKPCDSIGTNNCRWKIINVKKIVESKCLIKYANDRNGTCDQFFPESFFNCPGVSFDTSKEWIKGSNHPAHCPRVISGCVGETFPSAVFSESVCAQECLSCSRRNELAAPSAVIINSLTSFSVSLLWNPAQLTLYGDELSFVSYNLRLYSAHNGSISEQTTRIPSITIEQLDPSSAYSIHIRASSPGKMDSQEIIAKFTTPDYSQTN